MTGAERERIRQAVDEHARADRTEVLWIQSDTVPLEGDLIAEIRRLRNLCNRKQARIRRLEISRDFHAARARSAERDAELLREGIEWLTR